MKKTYSIKLFDNIFIYHQKLKFANSIFYILSLNIVSIMFGFFISNILSTLPTQTGDWGIISAAIIVAFNETISIIIYRIYNKKNNIIIKLINNIKIGIIYGLFVDAFKLGS